MNRVEKERKTRSFEGGAFGAIVFVGSHALTAIVRILATVWGEILI